MHEYEQNIEIMKDLKTRLDKVLDSQVDPRLNIQPKDTSKGHFYLSIVKSVLRLGAGVALATGFLATSGALFITAELFGIAEELV